MGLLFAVTILFGRYLPSRSPRKPSWFRAVRAITVPRARSECRLRQAPPPGLNGTKSRDWRRDLPLDVRAITA